MFKKTLIIASGLITLVFVALLVVFIFMVDSSETTTIPIATPDYDIDSKIADDLEALYTLWLNSPEELRDRDNWGSGNIMVDRDTPNGPWILMGILLNNNVEIDTALKEKINNLGGGYWRSSSDSEIWLLFPIGNLFQLAQLPEIKILILPIIPSSN